MEQKQESTQVDTSDESQLKRPTQDSDAQFESWSAFHLNVVSERNATLEERRKEWLASLDAEEAYNTLATHGLDILLSALVHAVKNLPFIGYNEDHNREVCPGHYVIHLKDFNISLDYEKSRLEGELKCCPCFRVSLSSYLVIHMASYFSFSTCWRNDHDVWFRTGSKASDAVYYSADEVARKVIRTILLSSRSVTGMAC